MTGRLVALLVGIDAYPPPLPSLEGCVHDVRAFADLLAARVPSDRLALRLLTDAQATRDATIAAIRDHLGTAAGGDAALLYFSGHGSQGDAPAELWALEPDRRVETLVLADSRQPHSWDLADKELAVLLGDVAARGAHVLAILDCCHSGGGTRAGDEARLRLAQSDARTRPLAAFLPAVADAAASAAGLGPVRSEATARSVGGRWTSGAGSQVLIAACRSSETAKETTVLGRPRGALSAALESALRGGAAPTYRQLHRLVTAAVLRRVEGQHPQLEATDGADLDRPFLGGAVPPVAAQLVVSRLPDGWSIDAGAVHGIPEPLGADATELAVHALDAATTAAPLATATVVRVLPDRSLVTLSTTLDPERAYRAVVTSIPLPPLRFAVVGDDPDAVALRTAAAAAEPTLVALTASSAGADVVVRSAPEGFTVTRPGVRRPVVPVVGGERRTERTIRALEHVARWLRLADLANPHTGLPADAVGVRLSTPGGAAEENGRLEVAYAGDTPPAFSISLTNACDRVLWCALLDLTDAYGIYADALPAGSVALEPGASTSVDLVGQVPDELAAAGVTSVTDHLKVVVSTLEFDPRSLQQDDLDVAASGPDDGLVGVASDAVMRGAAAVRTTLDRLLARVATRSADQPVAADSVADWRTDDFFVETHRQPLR